MSNRTIMPGQGLDFDDPNHSSADDGPIECLGKTFENDAVRREHYLGLLAEKLKDPEFRKIEGFPIGEDEDILNLSDPPYYTACPNPFMEDFVAHYGRPYDTAETYRREPYAADVSEGKKDPIYNAHSYHTKVPHKAIMRYILHYTNPGDVVFDGFCGTGMTGVAAQLCDDKTTVESLGYRVLADGTVSQEITNGDTGKAEWVSFSKLGARTVILNDLSTAAGFIAYNYNNPINAEIFEQEALNILDEVENECGWMYETLHSDKKTMGKINYTVWSDVFICPECAEEVIFSEVAVDKETARVNNDFLCIKCNSHLSKRTMDRAWVSKYDNSLKETIKQSKRVPVLINYSVEGERFEKSPDENDFDVLDKIELFQIPYRFPIDRLMNGKETRRNDISGITHMHHFYFKRGLWVLGCAYSKACNLPENIKRYILFTVQQAVQGFAKISRYVPTHFSQVNQYLSGTLYVGSQIVDVSLPYILNGKIKRLSRMLNDNHYRNNSIITTQDSSSFSIADSSVDYVFIDPPFGANLNYSELNFLWESWLRNWTNNKSEAIENSIQGKGVSEYRQLMGACFAEIYRILKPGRWMTVEFSNTKASVWNSIQTALNEAGFIVANVSALDKKQGSFKAVTTPTAVKQDLVISAYKPNGGFEGRFLTVSDEEGVWDFIRTHLVYLPIVKKESKELVKIPERDPRILYDEVVAYFVRNLRDVPLSSKEFQKGLRERFTERDGMVFLSEQVSQYDKERVTSTQLRQLTIFVDGEASAIEWLRQLLNDKPQSYQYIYPKFFHEIIGWKKLEEKLELSTLLEQNFIKYDGIGPLPPQIHSYLSTNFKEFRKLKKDDLQLIKKAKDRWYVPNPDREEDLQKLRERSLLSEFEDYKKHTGKKLKKVRMEAVRCGFKKAWQERDYSTIISAAEKIPQQLLQEDQKLLMWYDQAQTRASDDSLF